MAGEVGRKEYRITTALSKEALDLVDHAARLRGWSRAEFVRNAAVRAAEEALMEHRLIRMSTEGFADFLDVLSAPAGPVPEMVELTRRSAPWEAGYQTKR